MPYLFTSESVTSGHPDKLCDLISDSILDACISIDINARVAIEVFVKGLDDKNNKKNKSYIIIGGEISMSSNVNIDYEKIARECALEIGYSDIKIGMDARSNETCEVIILISRQSEEISQGISINDKTSLEQGAGDQGIIFGFATDESENYELTKGSYMPLPILLAHKITLEITKKRLEGNFDWARPDGKSQVTVAYDKFSNPLYVDTIVVAIQHDDMVGSKFNNEALEQEFIRNEIIKLIYGIIPKKLINENMKIIVNGTGRFCKGGPHADAGITGRKIIVDTYGGSGRHGGGAFSGKDPSKVDRSAAYAARWAAKNIVASGLTGTCEIQLSYSIGMSEPISISINADKISDPKITNEIITEIALEVFDFRPFKIIEKLNLLNPIYKITTSGGHFGRNGISDNEFTWERLDPDIIEKILRIRKGLEL